MILETTEDDYSRLITGLPPRQLSPCETPISSPEVLALLSGVADRVRKTFQPASWLIVEGGQAVGLCSIVRPPKDGVIEIGYGIAPSYRQRGVASRAISEIVAWARCRHDVKAIAAETSKANFASQKVLSRNGFVRVGEREDPEDGLLICWLCATED